VTHYLDWSPANNPVCSRTVAGEPVRSYCLPDAFSGVPDLLYENLGNGSFRDVSEAAGVGLRTGKGLGVLAADLIGDPLPDLYVANDTVPNFLFENRGGLRFREWGLPAGLAYDGDGNALAGMGIAAADIEPDGDLDLFVTNFQGEANNLYVADRHGAFRDVSFLSGIGRPSLAWLGFGTVFADLDNDGAPDLCVTNGHVLDNAPVLYPGTDYRQRDVCFRNRGGAFEPVVLEMPPAVGRGLVTLDFDGDGRLDLAVSRSGGPAALLRNGADPANRAVLRLTGRVSNRDGVGAEVVVERGGRVQRSVVTAGSSYLSSSAREVWVGLADGVPDSVRVRWPAGTEQAVPVDGPGVIRVVEAVSPPGD
jgi:hypothetical protein